MTSTTRLLRLLSLLQSRRDWPGAVLGERLGVSDRTVRRDIERLRELGYRIRSAMGPDGGYRLDAGSELPPLLFDDEQAIAIAVALRAASVAGAGVEQAALRALTTVRQVMPPRLRHRVDAVEFTALPPGRAATVPTERLVAVAAAARALEVLRFDYATPGAHDEPAPSPPRRAEPHHLVATGGRWYLVAWDLDRDDWRILRLDRIALRTPNGPRFRPRAVPGGDVARFVAARFTGSPAGAWPCIAKVELALPAAAVVPFAGDGVVEHLGPERCSLEVGAWSWIALAASLLRFDADVAVVDAPELVEAFGVLAARAATIDARAPE